MDSWETITAIERDNQERDREAIIYHARNALIEAMRVLGTERAQRDFLDEALFKDGYRSSRRRTSARWESRR